MFAITFVYLFFFFFASLVSALPIWPRSHYTPSPRADDANRKYVVAHMMVGNTFPYTLESWKNDIALAHSTGIDGFALNIGRDEWQPGHIADA
jgi:glucan endo-1,3-alpha-glucosidase